VKFDPIYGSWLDQLLADIAEKIQLTPSAYERAVARYNTIAAYLADGLSGIAQLNPVIYPQGSFRVGTTISAHEDDEDYDIDLVLELGIPVYSDPNAVLQLVADVMERGKGRLHFKACKKKKRCITIEYSDMHLDITPAVLRDGSNPRVLGIFDRHPGRPDHAIANPEGFAKWFDEKVQPAQVLQKRALRAETYPVPDQKAPEEKPVRVLSIQLLKRYRDIASDRRHYARCPSVLLSKLAVDAPHGGGLHGDLRVTTKYLASAVMQIPPPVENPRCCDDKLSDRWPMTASDQQAFAQDLLQLDAQLARLGEEGTQAQKQRILEELFGERPARRAYESAAARLGKQSATGELKLGMGRGAAGLGLGLVSPPAKAIAVPGHRFYGSDD
jgi:hypothetical protein